MLNPALELLINHKKPYELPILGADSKHVFVNTQTATSLNLIIPDELEPNVIRVEMTE